MTSSEVMAKMRQRRFNAATNVAIFSGRSGEIVTWTTAGTVAAETKKYANKSEITIVRKNVTAIVISCVYDIRSRFMNLSVTRFINASSVNGAYPKSAILKKVGKC